MYKRQHWEGVESVIDNFKNALSDVKDILNSFLSLIEKFNTNNSNDLKLWGDVMGDVIDKRIEALNKQKEALEENNDATERAIELAKAQDELARAEQQRTSRVSVSYTHLDVYKRQRYNVLFSCYDSKSPA